MLSKSNEIGYPAFHGLLGGISLKTSGRNDRSIEDLPQPLSHDRRLPWRQAYSP